MTAIVIVPFLQVHLFELMPPVFQELRLALCKPVMRHSTLAKNTKPMVELPIHSQANITT